MFYLKKFECFISCKYCILLYKYSSIDFLKDIKKWFVYKYVYNADL